MVYLKPLYSRLDRLAQCHNSPFSREAQQEHVQILIFKMSYIFIKKKTGAEKYWVYSVVVDFLFIVTPIVGVCNCSMFCCTLLYVHSSIAIILMGKRELVALLNLSSWCLVMVERLFLAVPRGCLQFFDCGIS